MENSKKDNCLFSCNTNDIIKNGVSSIEVIDTINPNRKFVPYKSNKDPEKLPSKRDSEKYTNEQTIVFKNENSN